MNYTNSLRLTKTTSFLFSLLILTLLVIGCETSLSKESKLIDWIPQNSSWVVLVNDLNSVKNELNNNEIFKQIKSLNPKVTSDISELLSETPNVTSLLCVTKVGKDPGALTHIYKSSIDSTLIAGPGIEYSKMRINIEKRENTILYSTFISGYTLRSTSQLLIENCIRKYQQTNNSETKNLFITVYAVSYTHLTLPTILRV